MMELRVTEEADDGTDSAELIDFGVLFEADSTWDNKADFSDLRVFSGAYGCCWGNRRYHPDRDLNNSGCVDFDDLPILSGNYGGAYP